MWRRLNGRLYVGVCGEITGGLSAWVVAYDPERRRTDYLVEMAAVLGHPADNGEATHSKVHKCLLQDDDGTIYAATHCTGAPLGDWIWRPWNCWNHPVKYFSGAGLTVFRPDGELIYTTTLFPREGARCMALARRRRRLYIMSYPRNHFCVYDLETRSLRDFGRISQLNPQCIFLDAAESGYTTGDYGEIIKFDADRGELLETGAVIPHESFRNGYHATLYDATPSPDGESVWGTTWTWGERLFRYDFAEGRIEDFGLAFGESDPVWDHIIHTHVGGMVFGPDGGLYYTVNRRSPEGSHPWPVRFDTGTRTRELIGPLVYDGRPGDHISRGVCGTDGALYFAEAGNTPTKLFRCDLGFSSGVGGRVRRLWG